MKTTEKQPLLNGQQNVSEIDKQNSSELIKRTEMDNSPFTIITTEEGSFGTLGKYKVTETKGSPEIVAEELNMKTWNQIATLIQLLIEENLYKL